MSIDIRYHPRRFVTTDWLFEAPDDISAREELAYLDSVLSTAEQMLKGFASSFSLGQLSIWMNDDRDADFDQFMAFLRVIAEWDKETATLLEEFERTGTNA